MEAAKLNILVVDDDELALSVLVQRLRALGHSCTAAKEGSEALRLLEAGRPDAIFVDWQMPNMDGLDFIDEVRQRCSDRDSPYTVMVSAESDPQRLVVAEDVGLDDYLIKPVVTADLNRVLKSACLSCAVDRKTDRDPAEEPPPTSH